MTRRPVRRRWRGGGVPSNSTVSSLGSQSISTASGASVVRITLSGRPLGDDRAVGHDGDAVAQALRLVHVVRREQHGGAARAQIAHARPQRQAHGRIEPGGRLVEHQQLRLDSSATWRWPGAA